MWTRETLLGPRTPTVIRVVGATPGHLKGPLQSDGTASD